MRAAVVGLIRCYQLVISPMLPAACRFYPSCSHYAADSVRSYGIVRGGWLALCRLARCHPWHPGGVDFVPAMQSGQSAPRLGSR